MLVDGLVNLLRRAETRSCPHKERNLVLHRRSYLHRHAVHEQVVLAERLAVVGHEQHSAVPALHRAQRVYQSVQEMVNIEDRVVVCVHKLRNRVLGVLHVHAHRLEHLEFLRILGTVAWSVVGGSVQHDEHLVLAAGLDALAQSCEEDFVILSVHARITSHEAVLGQILGDMHWRLAPVGRSPRDIDTGSVEVVREYLVEVACSLVLEYALGAGSRVGVARHGWINEQSILLRELRVGVPAVAVEREVGFARRLAYDKHHGGLLLVGDGGVGQLDFLLLLLVVGIVETHCVHDVRPRHQPSAQLGVVFSYPKHLVGINHDEYRHNEYRQADGRSESLPRTVVHFLRQDIDRRNNAKHDDEQRQLPRHEARSLGVAGVEYVAYHGLVHEVVVLVYEEDARRAQQMAKGDEHPADIPHKEHDEIARHEVRNYHDQHEANGEQHFARKLRLRALPHERKERNVVKN